MVEKYKSTRSQKIAQRKARMKEFRIATDAIDSFERLYGETKNPLYAWNALCHARANNVLIPIWVREYLTDAGNKLLARAKEGSHPKQAEVIAATLGFRGSGRGFAEYNKFGPTALMRDLYLQLRRDGAPKKEALTEVGEKFGVKDWRTASKMINRLCSALDESLADVERKNGIPAK